jgi:hypothetical protein
VLYVVAKQSYQKFGNVLPKQDGKAERRYIFVIECTVFNKFGFTAINCPRSLQFLYCQRMLSCTLQRIYSSVASLSGSQSRKACNSGGDCVAACKPVISDFAREIPATANSNCAIRKIRRLLQFWVLTTIQLLLQNSPLKYNCTGNHYIESRDSVG